MAVAVLLIGVGTGLGASVLAWATGTSLLLVTLAYPLGGAVGSFLAGLALALCRGRAEAVAR